MRGRITSLGSSCSTSRQAGLPDTSCGLSLLAPAATRRTGIVEQPCVRDCILAYGERRRRRYVCRAKAAGVDDKFQPLIGSKRGGLLRTPGSVAAGQCLLADLRDRTRETPAICRAGAMCGHDHEDHHKSEQAHEGLSREWAGDSGRYRALRQSQPSRGGGRTTIPCWKLGPGFRCDCRETRESPAVFYRPQVATRQLAVPDTKPLFPVDNEAESRREHRTWGRRSGPARNLRKFCIYPLGIVRERSYHGGLSFLAQMQISAKGGV